MLSLAKAAKDYYLRKLGELSPREDYYLRGGMASGIWRGSGAAELELEGTVSAEGLVRLFDGEHPGTGEQLGRRLRRDGVAAWDVTFSADKSVSLLWALGDKKTRQQVMAAFDEATSQAFGYLESVASATRGASKTPVLDEDGDPVLNGNRSPKFRVETWPIPTSGYVAASFTEFTSRADDPQLHTHVVIANKVKGKDGIWRTVDGRLLYRYQLAAGYLHEAVLRHELTQRMGVRWQPVRNGMADIEGFTRHQIEAFSRRREQLEQWRVDQGLPDTPAARQAAVLATRTPKRDHPLETLEAAWRRRALKVGLTPDRIERMMGRSRQVTPPDPQALYETLASPDGLTAQASTFTTPEVVKEIAGSLPEGATRDEIEGLAETFLTTRDIVPLLPGADAERPTVVNDEPLAVLEPHEASVASDAMAQPMRRHDGAVFPSPDVRRYTTAELLATEQRIIDHALAGLDADRWMAPHRLLEAWLRRRRGLTNGQLEMVRRFATSGNTIDVGIGPAGSGKTAVMVVISQLAAITGTPIVGAALAARAAAGLEAATGIPSTTLTRLIGQARAQGGLPLRVVVVVDEAGMVGTRQLAAISDLIEDAAGKLILIGDDHQLAEIDAGGLFRALANRLPTVTLTDNVRQHEPWERAALTQLRDGSVDQAMAMYRQHRRLIVGHDRHETITRAVDDWYHYVSATGDLTSGLLIAHDNNTVAELNEQARSHLAGARRLHGVTLETRDRAFQAGDRILCRQNQRRLGVLNGDLGTVIAVNPEAGTVTVELDRDPATRALPAWYLEEGHVDYGYALTGHKAQGVTTGRTFTVITGATDREWAYVALSRGRQANTLYLADPQPGDEHCTHLTHPDRRDTLDRLTASLGRSSAQLAAIDQYGGPSAAANVNNLASPPSSDVAERTAWIIAQHRTEHDQLQRSPRGVDLAAGR